METKITSATFTLADGTTKSFELDGIYIEYTSSSHEGKGQPPKDTVMKCIRMHGILERPKAGLYAKEQ